MVIKIVLSTSFNTNLTRHLGYHQLNHSSCEKKEVKYHAEKAKCLPFIALIINPLMIAKVKTDFGKRKEEQILSHQRNRYMPKNA